MPAPDAVMTEKADTDAETLRRIAGQIAGGIAGIPASGEPRAGPRLTPAVQALAKLAHELRTPLSAIVAAAEIMRDERFGPIGDNRYREYASGIYDGAYHALGVINAMLGTASSSDNGDAIAFTQLDLNDTASKVAASVQALMEAAGLKLEQCLEPRLPNVVADPVTVRQMILNLVTNALRATPSGGTVTIATSYELAGPIHLTITDTGSGMTPAEIDSALDPTASASEFEPRPSGGLGLGYPLVLRLASINGAKVTIASAGPPATAGTAVRITFAAGRVIPV